MPTFFEGLKRFAQGKPIFDPADESVGNPDRVNDESPEATLSVANPSGIRKGDVSSFPVVVVSETDVHHSGSHEQVYCHIHNSWSGEILLDKIRLLGGVRELDSSLRAGETRQFLVYDGPALQQPRYDQVVLQYSTRERDYFESVHEITFRFDADKTYEVNEIKFHPPVRDIYG